MLDLVVVIQQLRTHLRSVWQVRRHLYFVRVQTAPHADAGLVVAVRLGGSEEEKERRTVRSRLEKVLEVGGVVAGVDARGRIGLQAPAVFGPDGMPLQASGPPVARGPGLADESGVIPGIFEEVGEQRVLRRQRSVEHARLSDAPDMASGQQSRTRGRARGASRVRLREHDSLGGDPIERRRAHHWIPERRSVRIGLVVGVNEQDVRSPVDPRPGASGGSEQRRPSEQLAPGERGHSANAPFLSNRLPREWTSCSENLRNSAPGAGPSPPDTDNAARAGPAWLGRSRVPRRGRCTGSSPRSA